MLEQCRVNTVSCVCFTASTFSADCCIINFYFILFKAANDNKHVISMTGDVKNAIITAN